MNALIIAATHSQTATKPTSDVLDGRGISNPIAVTSIFLGGIGEGGRTQGSVICSPGEIGVRLSVKKRSSFSRDTGDVNKLTMTPVTTAVIM